MLLFQPKSELIGNILDDLMDPDLSMRDVAQRYDTTIDALSAWLAEPATRERLELVNTVSAQRTRLTANILLPNAMTALNRIVTHPQDLVAPDATPEHRRRASETLRRAAHLLLRLANFNPRPLHATINRPSDPVFDPPEPQGSSRAKECARIARELFRSPASSTPPSPTSFTAPHPHGQPPLLPNRSALTTITDCEIAEPHPARRVSPAQTLAALAGNLGFSTPKTVFPRTG